MSSSSDHNNLGLTRRSTTRRQQKQQQQQQQQQHYSPAATEVDSKPPHRPSASSRRQNNELQQRRRSFRGRCICMGATLSVLIGAPGTLRLALRRQRHYRHQQHHYDGQSQQQRTTNQRHNLRNPDPVRDHHPSARMRSLCLLDDNDDDNDGDNLMHSQYIHNDSFGPCPVVMLGENDDGYDDDFHDEENDDDDDDHDHDDTLVSGTDDAANGVETAHNPKCKPRQTWHRHPHPNCNTIYEQWDSVENLRKINEGYTTAVYEMLRQASPAAVSTPPDADWHRASAIGEEWQARRSDRFVFKVNLFRDSFENDAKMEEATLLERLSRSPYIPNIYGYCGTSTLNPFAASGTLYDLIKSIRFGGDEYLEGHVDALRIGVQVAEGLAALHDADGTGHPTFAQNDLDVSQYIYDEKSQTFQLADLNDGHLVLYDEDGEPCKAATSGMKPWKYRSPEDLAALRRKGPPFHVFASDVFSLGGVLYMILTKQWLWEDDESREVGTDKIIRGQLPPIPEELSGSNQDEAIEALVQAIYGLCWVYDPDERASAQEVATYLKGKLESIRPGEISGDGVGRSRNVQVKLPSILTNVLDLDDDYDAKM